MQWAVAVGRGEQSHRRVTCAQSYMSRDTSITAQRQDINLKAQFPIYNMGGSGHTAPQAVETVRRIVMFPL